MKCNLILLEPPRSETGKAQHHFLIHAGLILKQRGLEEIQMRLIEERGRHVTRTPIRIAPDITEAERAPKKGTVIDLGLGNIHGIETLSLIDLEIVKEREKETMDEAERGTSQETGTQIEITDTKR